MPKVQPPTNVAAAAATMGEMSARGELKSYPRKLLRGARRLIDDQKRVWSRRDRGAYSQRSRVATEAGPGVLDAGIT